MGSSTYEQPRSPALSTAPKYLLETASTVACIVVVESAPRVDGERYAGIPAVSLSESVITWHNDPMRKERVERPYPVVAVVDHVHRRS